MNFASASSICSLVCCCRCHYLLLLFASSLLLMPPFVTCHAINSIISSLGTCILVTPPWKRLRRDCLPPPCLGFIFNSYHPFLILRLIRLHLLFLTHSFSWLRTVRASPLDFFRLVFHLTSLLWLFGVLLFNIFDSLRYHHCRHTIYSSLHASTTVLVTSSLARPLTASVLHSPYTTVPKLFSQEQSCP